MSDDELPIATVVIPMLDEAEHIEACLDAFGKQTYPLDHLDVVVVDGGSTDGSRALVEARAAREPWIRVVDNAAGRASAAFNRGVEAAKGSVVFLFSAHGVPENDYVASSVTALRESGVAGVGGRYEHVGLDRRSSAIGLAMVSPFGMASPHRFAARRQEVDTISHPAYRREVMLEVGPFDETLLRNSDYEFNYRMRALGYRLLFDPSVGSIYRPRPSLRALARQFWWYGRWKARVVARHPGSRRARHLVPPAVVVVLSLSPILAGFPSGRRLLPRLGGLYGALVLAAVVHSRPSQHQADPLVLAAAFPVMHVSWGAGYLTSVLQDRAKRAAA